MSYLSYVANFIITQKSIENEPKMTTQIFDANHVVTIHNYNCNIFVVQNFKDFILGGHGVGLSTICLRHHKALASSKQPCPKSFKKSMTIELSIKSMKERRNYGFDPSLRKLCVKNSLILYTLELVLEVG